MAIKDHSSSFPLPASMGSEVVLHTRREVEYAGKKTLAPTDLLVTSDDGEWLKVPAYAPFVLQVLAGKHVAAKNSSLKKSELLHNLLAKRNAAVQQKLSQQDEPEAPDVLGLQKKEGQEQHQKMKSKKRKACSLEDTTKVSIDVNGVAVDLLCPTFRSEQASLVVKMDSHMLSAVFDYLQPDVLPFLKPGKPPKIEKKEDSDQD